MLLLLHDVVKGTLIYLRLRLMVVAQARFDSNQNTVPTLITFKLIFYHPNQIGVSPIVTKYANNAVILLIYECTLP